MYPDWAWLLILAVFVWLAILTLSVWQQNKFLKLLFPKSGVRDIRKKFGETVAGVVELKEDLNKLANKLSEVERSGYRHIQKMQLSRYNPYDDTGGNQSFTLALLDNGGSGIVVTSLHARSGTRVFAKDVIGGKMGKYQFSKEEEEMIKKAMT
ncbi:hypothetical protein A3C26_01075 [Candidatus Daviesbacteria bacterium RIFCSPHIGHO2_02_FULL_39_12]|uniref:DUF4446 domain-containing protein n=2 Tax=Candidatus Daviesiibacteriota TaxID=1752718 RepID=A0A1F5JDI9_9BACT|nr:MAG: hypothetical protein A3C26_01075 [Candidatus Daviesbacteria bacterium RIFCSPHIGHO2_02_FULL_39_12]OGE72643.1 MAG: hypothetical protein A3H40_01145 [Candidatus Daviesbacteria bacterium RIFCSPLOWO2_02_FULL_38_15]